MGERPVLLLSREGVYQRRDSVTVALITTRIRQLRTEVQLGTNEGLRRLSVANLDNMLTTDKRLLLNYLGALSSEKMREVDDAIHFALGLSY
jgi:mRNA interferase MazF